MATIATDAKGNRTIQFKIGKSESRKSIRLGKMSMRFARAIKDRVEALVSAKIAGFSPDPEVLDWLAKAGDVLCDRLAGVGLMPHRSSVNLGPFLKSYIDGRTDVSGGSIRNMGQAARYLREHFGESRPLRSISITDAEAFAIMMKSDYAEATAARIIKYARQFWDYAVRARFVPDDIWDHIKAGKMNNQDRQVFVDRPTIAKVIETCPDAEWRLIVAMARFGGLRIPSELYVLEWDDILWDKRRFVVRAPKTGTRIVPLFPELRPYLEECYDLAAEKTSHVIAKHRNKSLRTRMDKIITRAGFSPWEKTFQNLRSSRQTELTDEFPDHVVCKWLGNSEKVARAHYQQLTEAHFERAANSGAFLVDMSGHERASNEQVGGKNTGNSRETQDRRETDEQDHYARRESNPQAETVLKTRPTQPGASIALQIPVHQPVILNPFLNANEPLIDEQTLLALQVRAFLQGDIE